MLLLVALGGTYLMENPVNSLVALHPRYVWFCERLQELGIPDPQLVGVHVHACILYHLPVGCFYGTLLYVNTSVHACISLYQWDLILSMEW